MFRLRAAIAGVLALVLVAPLPVAAQDTDSAATRSLRDALAHAFVEPPIPDVRLAGGAGRSSTRACDACPERHVGRALISTAVLHGFYNVVNRTRGHETARIGPSSWWSNLRHGFEWDANPFMVNQFGHPYQGTGAFTAGRAWGMSFWESSAVAAFGSVTWEFFGENNRASLNDVINTTFGGIALGEIFHRTAWLIRDTRATGARRFMQEVAAGALDPMTGFARFVTGDASRVSDRPDHLIPDSLAATASAGVLWQGSTAEEVEGSATRFAELDLRYGDPRRSRVRTPYEAFTLRFRFGGGATISDVRVRGKLFGQAFGADDRYQVTVAQTFDYVSNRAYSFGGQGVEAGAGFTHRLSPRSSVWLAAWGGLSALGAIDSRPPRLRAEDFSRPREYDYGPGSTFGGTVRVARTGRDIAAVSYQGYQIYVVDGLQANHVLQRGLIEWLVPLRGSFSVGTSLEFFYRKTFFATGEAHSDRFSQVRLFLTKSVADAESRPHPVRPPALPSPSASRLWLVAGGGYSVARSGCADCDDNGVYRRTRGLSFNAGLRVTPQLDAGAEVAWVPAYVETGEPMRTTFLLGVVQFRPWRERGVFLQGGMGVGIIRNWIAGQRQAPDPPRFRSNALALGYGGGWVFRGERRVTLQMHATHRVAALGDFTSKESAFQNVVGNYWTLGAGLVIR